TVNCRLLTSSHQSLITSRQSLDELVRRHFGLRRRLDADEPPLASPILKLHEARDHSVQRIIAAPPDIVARLALRPAPPHKNRACIDQLPAEALHAQPLSVGIAAVY